MQTVTGSAALSVAALSMAETMNVQTWFVNPRIGLLWTWKPGVTFGIEAGVQLPVTTTVSSTIPVESLPADVTRTASTVGQTVLPTVDLLRVGFLF
jgi:hypothetical protein